MSTDLDYTYATLKRLYEKNHLVILRTPPKYLQNIVGSSNLSDKIIYFYNEDHSKATAHNFTSSPNLMLNPKSKDIDLTGSPLKDECSIDAIEDSSLEFKLCASNFWSNDEECHRGISCEKARAYLSSPYFQDNKLKEGTVWILCSGTDSQNTLFFQYSYMPNIWNRGIVTFVGMVRPAEITIRNLLESHYNMIQSGTPIEYFIKNTYNIKPYLVLRCFWSSSAKKPVLLNVNYCDVTLMHTWIIDDSGSLTDDLINQLRILMLIRNDIIAYKNDLKKELVYRCGRGIDIYEMPECLTKILTEMSGFTEIKPESELEDFNFENVLHRSKFRRLTDLTDELYDTLKCCSSYEDLKKSFDILFQAATRCNILNLPTNKNRLAEILIELANGRLAVPCLSGTEPMELLLEIGLEKLYKDYEYIFTETQICAATTLRNKCIVSEEDEIESATPNLRKSLHNAVDPNTTKLCRKTLLHNTGKSNKELLINVVRNSNFDQRETKIKLSNLFHIHCTLEHLLAIHVHLNLSVQSYTDIFSQLFSQPTKLIDLIDDNKTDTIDITLNENAVREHLKDMLPHSRRISMTSKNKFQEVKSTFYYNLENICPPGVVEHFPIDERETSQQSFYYHWMYQNLKSFKL